MALNHVARAIAHDDVITRRKLVIGRPAEKPPCTVRTPSYYRNSEQCDNIIIVFLQLLTGFVYFVSLLYSFITAMTCVTTVLSTQVNKFEFFITKVQNVLVVQI